MEYLKPLQSIFEENRNPDYAARMQSYMKALFPYLGIQSPRRRELTRIFFREAGLPEIGNLETVLQALWVLPEREYQYVGLDLLKRLDRRLTPAVLPLLEELILTKSWWDTVDMLAGRSVGDLLLKHPESRDPVVDRWRQSENLWLRRSTLLFQLHYRMNTDLDLLFSLIQENLGSHEFFINKAIGWALREYSKTDGKSVLRFVEQTALSPLSHREALKWLERRPLENKGLSL